MFDDATIIAITMSNVPSCYHDTIAQQLLIKGDVVTLDDIKLALKLKLRIQTDGDEVKDNKEEDKTVLSFNDTKVKCRR